MSDLLESCLTPQQRAQACAADAAEKATEIECAIATAAGSVAWAKKWHPDKPEMAAFAATLDRRAQPPIIPTPANRPDRIIAAGDAKRREYRDAYPTAGTAMIYGAQIGYLHSAVRKLCAEAETLEAVIDQAFEYVDIEVPSLSCEITVGFTYDPGSRPAPTSPQFFELTGDPGDPGEGDDLVVFEVWLRGVEISLILTDETNDQIEAAVRAKIAALVAESNEP